MAIGKLDRRAFLKGIGGTVIALPALEAMLGSDREAHAAGPPPKRYLVCFGGQSLGADDDPVKDMYTPDTVGANYDLKTALAPLSGFGNVKNEISVVSGLRIPTANGGAVPAGGRADDFHITSLSPLLSGVRSGAGLTVQGPSSDQIVADAIGGGTTFKSLVYRVQAGWYLSVSAPYGRDMMSYRKDSGGQLGGIPAIVSPNEAFNALFTGFVPPDPKQAARRSFLLKQRKSVLDLVSGRIGRLLTRVGTSDQKRLQAHFDQIRDLEKQISAIPPVMTGGCMQLPAPGSDPPVGGDQPNTNGTNGYSTNLGYSDEDARAKVFCDLIAMAFTCDLTRAASLMFTMAQSHMNTFSLINEPFDLHELGHSSPNRTLAVSQGIAWHMKHFGYLIARLRDTPEGGGSLLDSCAAAFLHEGGHGLDTSSGKVWSSHSTENMCCLIAGRAGGLSPGRHVVATGMHPANALVSAMNAVGVAGGLGEVSGGIPALTM